jgi:small subunit ribosomal protein S1
MAGPRTRRRKTFDPNEPEQPAHGAPRGPKKPVDAAAPEAPAADAGDRDKRGRKKRLADHSAPKRAPRSAKEVVTSPRLSELEAIAGMDDVDMASLLGATPLGTRLPEPGEKVTGTVMGRARDELQIDLGMRAQGFLPAASLPDVSVGDTIEAFVVWADDTGIQLSTRLSGDAAAALLDEAADSGIPVEGLVRSSNPGGYEVSVGGVRCFCPGSQISRIPLEDRDSVVGQTLSFRVLETGDKIVLSRRALEEEELEASRQAFLERVDVGQVYDAVTMRVTSWGAFLDIDGAEVMLPRREYSWDEVEDLSAHLARGAKLRVRIIEMDADSGRIRVSRRDPDLDPWATVTEQLTLNAVYNGRVVSQTDFGVFVEVKPGLQGLVHTSRLSSRMPVPGSTFEVRLLSIDPDRRRLELAPSDFDPEAQAGNDVGATVKGEVVEITDRGVVLRLEDGRRGWLPSREVVLPAGSVLAQRFRVGHKAEARVVDVKGDRVTLSQRPNDAAEQNAWRSQLKKSSSSGSMGTLGDLLGGWKKRGARPSAATAELVVPTTDELEVVEGQPLVLRLAKQVGGVERRDREDLAVRCVVPLLLPAVAHDAADPERVLERDRAQHQDHLGLDRIDLPLQEGLARVDLVGSGVAVLRRPALHHVGDVHLGSLQTEHVHQHLVEHLPGRPHEGLPGAVLLLPGPLPDDHEVGLGVSDAVDDVATPLAEPAAGAVAEVVADLGEPCRALAVRLTGLRRQRPPGRLRRRHLRLGLRGLLSHQRLLERGVGRGRLGIRELGVEP